MAKAWVVAYRYGKERFDEVDVVKSSGKQVMIANGVDASGYRTRLSPEDVHCSEIDALDALQRQVASAIEHTEAELLRHRDTMARVHDRRASLMAKKETP